MSYGPLAALIVSCEPHVLHAHVDLVRVVLPTARVFYGPERYIPGLEETSIPSTLSTTRQHGWWGLGLEVNTVYLTITPYRLRLWVTEIRNSLEFDRARRASRRRRLEIPCPRRSLLKEAGIATSLGVVVAVSVLHDASTRFCSTALTHRSPTSAGTRCTRPNRVAT